MNHSQRALAPFKRLPMDRFPFWYGASPEFTNNLIDYLQADSEDHALYDIIGIDYKTFRPVYVGPELKTFEDGSIETPWGIRRGGAHYGQALNHPMAGFESVRQVDAYPFPDPAHYITELTEEQKKWAQGYCVIGGSWAPFFHDSTELMGMEEFFINMYTNPAVVDAIIERCFSFYYELDQRVFLDNIHAIDMYFIGNDFGSQRALLLSPEMWRKYYKPRLKKLISQAKANGCVTAVHSCGAIREIIPDLIEIGIDAVNPIQVNAENMDPSALMREFGSDIVFFGGIDENEILLNGSEEQVRNETKRILDILGSKGRYIVAASHDYLLPEVPPQNVFAMYDEAKKYRMDR